MIFSSFQFIIIKLFAGVMELADVMDSKSIGLITRAGSTPAAGTNKKRTFVSTQMCVF